MLPPEVVGQGAGRRACRRSGGNRGRCGPAVVDREEAEAVVDQEEAEANSEVEGMHLFSRVGVRKGEKRSLTSTTQRV